MMFILQMSDRDCVLRPYGLNSRPSDPVLRKGRDCDESERIGNILHQIGVPVNHDFLIQWVLTFL